LIVESIEDTSISPFEASLTSLSLRKVAMP
jgi:hypothetical protein